MRAIWSKLRPVARGMGFGLMLIVVQAGLLLAGLHRQ